MGGARPASATSLEPEIEGHRADARQLKSEAEEQRSREWAIRSAELRRMKGRTAPRVDDQHGPEITVHIVSRRVLLMTAGTFLI